MSLPTIRVFENPNGDDWCAEFTPEGSVFPIRVYGGTQAEAEQAAFSVLEDWDHDKRLLERSRINHPAGKLLPRVSMLGEEFDDDFDLAVRDVFNEAQEMLLRKHEDYGPTNIANAPGGALNGLRVRIHDKVARINHLIDSGADAKNEPLRDSFLDLANYAIIAMLVLDGEWPSE